MANLESDLTRSDGIDKRHSVGAAARDTLQAPPAETRVVPSNSANSRPVTG